MAADLIMTVVVMFGGVGVAVAVLSRWYDQRALHRVVGRYRWHAVTPDGDAEPEIEVSRRCNVAERLGTVAGRLDLVPRRSEFDWLVGDEDRMAAWRWFPLTLRPGSASAPS